MDDIDIELKIRDHVQLYGKTANGWENCIHSTCDHGKKGPRAAFLFNPSSISFNCFNCGAKAVLSTDDATSIPKKFQTIMEDFGIGKKDIDQINFNLLTKNGKKGKIDSSGKKIKEVSILPISLSLPSDFVMLEGNEETKAGKLAIAELSRRKIKASDYPFMLCIKASSVGRKKWEERLIIPSFRGNDLIFYQGQSLTGASPKYLNASAEKMQRSKIISNYDVLYEKSDEPIYVVEGWYDAYHLNGVAVFGNQIKRHQISWLNKSYRDKVYIPDRYGDGKEIALECLERGWNVSVPYMNLDTNIKDVSDMVSAYGALYTKKLIKQNTSTSKIDGQIKLSTLK